MYVQLVETVRNLKNNNNNKKQNKQLYWLPWANLLDMDMLIPLALRLNKIWLNHKVRVKYWSTPPKTSKHGLYFTFFKTAFLCFGYCSLDLWRSLMTAVGPFAHSKLDWFRSGHLICCWGRHAGSEGPGKHPHTSTPPPPCFMGGNHPFTSSASSQQVKPKSSNLRGEETVHLSEKSKVKSLSRCHQSKGLKESKI